VEGWPDNGSDSLAGDGGIVSRGGRGQQLGKVGGGDHYNPRGDMGHLNGVGSHWSNCAALANLIH
jgi:hypothetical protein